MGKQDTMESRIANAPRLETTARFQTVRMALNSGPMYFAHIMAAVGSDDGREVALELDALREEGVLTRLGNGEWALEEKQHG